MVGSVLCDAMGNGWVRLQDENCKDHRCPATISKRSIGANLGIGESLREEGKREGGSAAGEPERWGSPSALQCSSRRRR